jgi:hypothetical protein
VDLIGLIKMGTPVLILGMILFLERIEVQVKEIQKDVREIRRGITWQDTCNARHEEINRRFAFIDGGRKCGEYTSGIDR